MIKTLHIYVRVSSAEQVKGHSLDVQERKGIERAKDLGMSYVIHREEGASANYENTLNRPVLTALLALCKDQKVTDIFVTDIDRLTRNLRLVLDVERILSEHGITIHTLSATLDINDPDQRFHVIIQSVFAEHENTKRIRKIKHSLRKAAELGKWIGVNTPYGYCKDDKGCLQIDIEEANVYRKMIDLTLRGYGTTTIAKELNRLGIPTKGSKVLKSGIKLPKTKQRYTARFIEKDELVWAPNVVRSILINPIYKGERNFKGEVFTVPSIIDRETFDKIQSQHKKNKNHSTTQRRYFYLLKNMLRCGCGRNLVGRIKPKDNEYYYQCSGKRISSCTMRSPNIHLLDAFVWLHLIYFPKLLQVVCDHVKLNRQIISPENLDDKIQQINSKINSIDQREQRLITLYETDRISLDDFDKRSNNLWEERRKLKIEHANLESQKELEQGVEKRIERITVNLGNPKEYLLDLSPEEKRQVLEDVIENIIVTWLPDWNAHLVAIEIEVDGVHLKTSKLMYRGTNYKKKILAGEGFLAQEFLTTDAFVIPHHCKLS